MSNEQDSEDLSAWHSDPDTRLQLKEARESRSAAMQNLLGAARQTSDPGVAATMATFVAVDTIVKIFGGKGVNDEWT